jgi:hypothetical protein
MSNSFKVFVKKVKSLFRDKQHRKKWLYETVKPVGGMKQVVLYRPVHPVHRAHSRLSETEQAALGQLKSHEVGKYMTLINLGKAHNVTHEHVRRRNRHAQLVARKRSTEAKRAILLKKQMKPEPAKDTPVVKALPQKPLAKPVNELPMSLDERRESRRNHRAPMRHLSQRPNMNMSMKYFAPTKPTVKAL